jgi:hypothetical protein
VYKLKRFCREVSSSHGRQYEDDCHLGSCADVPEVPAASIIRAIALMMEAAGTSGTSVNRRQLPSYSVEFNACWKVREEREVMLMA